MQRPGQRSQAIEDARAGPGDDDVVDGPDRLRADRRHDVPARASRHLVGRHAVGRVAEQDDLRVGPDQALERDVELGWPSPS